MVLDLSIPAAHIIYKLYEENVTNFYCVNFSDPYLIQTAFIDRVETFIL